MSDLGAGLLLLSNMKTPLTHLRNRPSPTRPPLGGRLHEMALTRTVPEPKVRWGHVNLTGGGLIPSPRMTVLGRPGRGKGALMKRLGATSTHSWPVVVIDPPAGYEVVLDELAGCEPLDLSRHDGVIDPLALGHTRSGARRVTAGEW